MRIGAAMVIAGALLAPAAAWASPGVGDPVYGATIEPGVTEFEARYARLSGGPANGEDGLVLEAEHAFSPRLSVAALVETARTPGRPREVQAVAVEGIYTFGRIAPLALDTAIYVEAKHGLHGEPDAIELKGLFEHRAGAFDGRLNLIAEQPLTAGEPAAFGYAASADWAMAGDELRLGLSAFGDLGTSRSLGGRQEHFAGPTGKFEIEHLGRGELELEAGWLRAFGKARDVTDGQARLLLGYETHF